MSNKRLFHYTVKSRLDLILADRIIKPATAMIEPQERPATWFSFNPLWENSSNKIISSSQGIYFSCGLEDMAKYDLPCRIEVNPSCAPYDWNAFKRLSGISKLMAEALFESSIEGGCNPLDWWVSFDSVGSRYWWAIECWNGKNWEPYSGWDIGNAVIELSEYKKQAGKLSNQLASVQAQYKNAQFVIGGLHNSIQAYLQKINRLESDNNELRQNIYNSQIEYQRLIDSHTPSVLELENQQLRLKKQNIKDELEYIILENDELKKTQDDQCIMFSKIIDGNNGHVRYLQSILRKHGIPFNNSIGHENNPKSNMKGIMVAIA